MDKKLILTFFLAGALTGASAQEVRCSVRINSDQIEGTYKQVFTSLENALTEFINTRKWSDTQFSNVEKIDCSLQFNIKSVPSQDRYSAELMVQGRRPVYNSSYISSTFNFKDPDVEFSYMENEPLSYNEYTIESNLVAIVSYYIYMILGVDFDTFSPKGGTPFFRQAENIVTLSQSGGEKGWKAFDSNKNRHALVNAYLDESLSSYRQVVYEYHRKGLDDMAQNPEKGRSRITASLEELPKIYEVRPQTVLLTSFLDTKIDELINVYSKANQTEKENVYKLLINIFPAYSSRLEAIRKENK